MIHVVSALIIRSGRVLLTQRDPARSDYGLLWESPGGKVEAVESHRQALKREVLEELGVVGEVLGEVASYPDLLPNLTLTFYRVDIATQVPLPLQAVGIGWFSLEEVRALRMPPGNVRLMAVGAMQREMVK